jgi:hypothetical protein
VGDPDALALNVAVCPAVTVWLWGLEVKLGAWTADAVTSIVNENGEEVVDDVLPDVVSVFSYPVRVKV